MTAPPPSAAAAEVFGAGLALAQHYAELLAGPGVTQGLIGPRERDRLWDRHLINCALMSELLPDEARVVDVGSGAGLPGIALACRRADLQVVLVESMQRRVDFLLTSVATLELDGQVRVVRGRIEDRAVVRDVGPAKWVTARALAPLDRLARWCLPLLASDGRLLALKGTRANDEVREHAAELRRAGAVVEDVVQCGVGQVTEPATVVVIAKR